jgi:hypothetical protein
VTIFIYYYSDFVEVDVPETVDFGADLGQGSRAVSKLPERAPQFKAETSCLDLPAPTVPAMWRFTAT